MSFSRHFIKLLIFTVLLAIINYMLISMTSIRDVALTSWISLIFFFLLTTMSYWYILRAFKKKSASDKNMAMYVNMFLKLMISLIAFMLLIQIFPAQKKLVAMPFMLYYFLFTIFEMYLIFKLKRPVAK